MNNTKWRRMKVYIETLGCPKNFNDSQMAAGILEKNNHMMVESPEAADAIQGFPS